MALLEEYIETDKWGTPKKESEYIGNHWFKYTSVIAWGVWIIYWAGIGGGKMFKTLDESLTIKL